MKKTTSSSFKIRVLVNERLVLTDTVKLGAESHVSLHPMVVNADDWAEFQVSWDDPSLHLFLRIGSEVVEEILPGRTANLSTNDKWFAGFMGESCLAIDVLTSPEAADVVTVYQLDLLIEPTPEALRDFRGMLDDLVQIHEGLAQDVVSRGFMRKSFQKEIPRLLVPGAMLEKLARLWESLSESIEKIAIQPSAVLVQTTCKTSYRPGDRIDIGTLAALAADGLIAEDRQLHASYNSKLRISRTNLDQDIAEHRHMAFRIRRLSRTALRVGSYCEQSANLIETDEKRWGQQQRGDVQSVYAQVGLPRVAQLRMYSTKAQNLGRRFAGLINANPFLADAGHPRTPFGPTPLFLGRPDYAAVYQALRSAEEIFNGVVDGDAVRIYFRDLAKLYEYWCFVKVVMALREILGPPVPYATFQLVDEIYRPEFLPGQYFEFQAGEACKIRVTYEPEIRPWNTARAAGDLLGATLTSRPLRPDVLIEYIVDGETVSAMVLDAKSGDRFSREKFKKMSDYSRQVLRTRDGGQPIRHVFALHRDRSRRSECNIPGYLEGLTTVADLHIIGALPCFQDGSHIPVALEAAIHGFLATNQPRFQYNASVCCA